MWASNDLPSFSRIADYRPPLVTTVLARDGSLIGELYRERRYLLTLDEMPAFVPKAFLAIEDDDFYSHPGIDLKAIVRAALTNFQTGEKSSGGSTITQQVVKRLMLTPEKSYERKLKEMILASRLEEQFSKDEILNLYLNQIFFGNNAYGVEAAARTFFAKHASDLSLAEAALLAALPNAPSRYNPFRHPEAAQTRQRLVLRRMRDLGWISDAEYDEAYYQPLEYASMPTGMGREGGWYLEEVRRQLIELFNEQNAPLYGFDSGLFGEDVVYEAGLTVRTSMDPLQQRTADAALRKGLEDAAKRHGWLGPVEELEPSQYGAFLDKHSFTPASLEKNDWVLALVNSVDKLGADVSLGHAYRGRVPVSTMGWARKPNKRVAGSLSATLVSDATTVLKPGDVIWVSLNDQPPAKGQAPFNLADASPDTVIPLRLQEYPDVQGAMVSIEPQTGDVVAMVGGYAFGSQGSQFNRATQAQRQPGSSFKPIVYSAALDNGFTAASMVLDAPILIVNEWTKQAWRPRNFEGDFEGPMRLVRALARSRNLCTVRVVQQMGVQAVIDRAKALGLTPDFPAEMAISLGAVAVSPLNMTQAYTAFANGGQVATPRFIQSIQGPWGNTIYEKQPELRQAISPENAYVMACMLKAVVNMGTGTKAKVLERPVGGKTGSTNDENDAWFLGVTPYLVTGTYIGYDQVQPMGRGETGSGAALPVYVEYARNALEAYPPDDFTAPEDIVFATVDGLSLPFIPGTQPGTGYGMDAMGGAPEAEHGEDLLKQLF
ncbi:MAG: PBP1A family penicillin-binding protein [Desulfovibrionaceae bacterium]|nr:PBP1A family penicillin-binding protein [Desulfovibrionaceae bacterium]